MRAALIFALLVGVGSASAKSEPDPATTSKGTPQEGRSGIREPDNPTGEREADSEFTWKWIVGIVLTAIISPLIVMWAGKKLTSDPVQDHAGRLKALIEVAALQKAHGLPDDPRIRGLINEQTDHLAGHSTGRQEALDAAVSALIADLSVRLCEALLASCQQLELLADSKHRSNSLLAVLDLTRLEFLRSAHAIECLQIPPHFKSISKRDVDSYVQHIGESESPIGAIAAKHATELGTTPEAVEAFVGQIRETVKSPSIDTQAARILRRNS